MRSSTTLSPVPDRPLPALAVGRIKGLSAASRWLPAVLCAAVIPLERGVGEVSTYARLSNVEGGSTAAGYEDWMEVSGIGSGVSVASESVDGSIRTVPISEAFVFRKPLDKASPYLSLAAMRGTVFDELEIEQEENGRVLASYRMRGVRLDGLRLLSPEADPVPAEELAFSFDVVEWHYFRESPEPGGSIHVGSTWDFAGGTGGELEDPDGEAPTISPVSISGARPGQTIYVAVQLFDPAGNPENLTLTALPSERGLVRVIDIELQGTFGAIGVEIGPYLNGSDRVTLVVSDGVRSSTRVMPILVEGEATPYERFVSGFLGERLDEDPELSGLLKDIDGDRMSNVLEFFLGTDPGGFTTQGDAIRFSHEETGNGRTMKMRYFRRVDTEGLKEEFEGTAGLGDWSVLGKGTNPRLETVVLPGGDGEYVPVEATVYFDETWDAGYFLRLSVKGSL